MDRVHEIRFWIFFREINFTEIFVKLVSRKKISTRSATKVDEAAAAAWYIVDNTKDTSS